MAQDAARDGSRVYGVGGIFFRTRDPEALYAWYERHFDLSRKNGSILFPPDAGPGLTVLAFFPQDTEYFGTTGQQAMLNLRVGDLDATLEKLAAAGVAIDPHREDYDYGRFAWITDPEGNRIELWQPS